MEVARCDFMVCANSLAFMFELTAALFPKLQHGCPDDDEEVEVWSPLIWLRCYSVYTL